MNHDFPYYLLDPVTGRLRFTATGRRVLAAFRPRRNRPSIPKRWHRPAPPPPKSPIRN